ncbi:ISL3 family transposase [Streptosporangium canum]|uniref:ISL3 family transposase n=1 Tax=Streptosporangium canum TaxID=324952 RepID=UPI0036B1818D
MADHVKILARTLPSAMACPSCGSLSSKVHSRYWRRLADTAVGGRRTAIMLQVRRLFCRESTCERRTFCEQVPGLTVRYGRKTPPLVDALRHIVVALAGRAGSRLARALHAVASRSTLLRLLMTIPDPPARTPRVLGVDDFALKRGHHYGTVLIDCESGAPIELLEGRGAAPLADWLAAHPGVEVICRDRSGAYAEGARTGAPEAIQVADRFHLWQNLTAAVERCVAAHRACLREPDPEPVCASDPEPSAPPAHADRPAPAGKFADRTRRYHQMVHELLADGHKIRAIARHLGWGRHTVQRYARAATWQELAEGRWQTSRPGRLDPFKPYLHWRLDEGCGNLAQLFREVKALGYTGSYSNVRDHLQRYRPAPAPLSSPPAPTVREVTGWLTRHPDSLTEDERPRLKALLERCPELRDACDHVRGFATMLTQLTGHDLPRWISEVRASDLPGISSFAHGLEQDLDAVVQGLTSPWNSGPVEGRVNHIKMIKRQMFGRAGLPLLRKRVLLTAAGR